MRIIRSRINSGLRLFTRSSRCNKGLLGGRRKRLGPNSVMFDYNDLLLVRYFKDTV